ncbi:MAG: hypothetical protein KDI64_11470 [Candidatus Accumulibacter sp.]|nr:hypothetical protein [Accumulibacter sp.]
MRPDLVQAQAFLTALDEGAASWSFQTFSDDGSGRGELVRLLHGSLEKHGATLEQLNDKGAGIFVTVNETDGRGRTKGNITRGRALFVDLDGAPIEPVLDSPAPPHIVVESSPNRYHAYWRVVDCPPTACEPALKELIRRFDGDPACSDRSRVLRLPGFLHRKREPFMVRVIGLEPGQYQLSELGIVLPTEEVQKATDVIFRALPCSSVGEALPRFLPRSLGQRNKCLFDLARWLRAQSRTATPDDYRDVVAEWHRLARPNIGTVSFLVSWDDFCRGWDSVRHPFGEALNAAVEAASSMTIPIPESLAALGYSDVDWLLVRICAQLQRKEGSKPFFISVRVAGQLLNCHFTDAASMLRTFVKDGVLELVKLGTGAVASRYRYVWPDEAAAAPGDHRRGADQETA